MRDTQEILVWRHEAVMENSGGLAMCKSHLSVIGFEGMKGYEEQLKLGTVRSHGRPFLKVQHQL